MSKKILVVDDDVMNLRMAEFILKQGNYEVCKAESGMECLLFLKEEKVDLILLDIEMPIMSGLKTFEIIKDNEDLAEIPVIFLTASADSDSVMEAGKLGAVGYVTKPFLPQDLMERVGKALGN
ncbi:MAG: response regulator [Lachnospiraceae bacterium]|nr:response regulator [Lachnospiraceae bacterium]